MCTLIFKSLFKIEDGKLVNEQRDRKTGDLQVTASREIVGGKMVEVIKRLLKMKKKSILKFLFYIKTLVCGKVKATRTFKKSE
jgi:hypothetical protein